MRGQMHIYNTQQTAHVQQLCMGELCLVTTSTEVIAELQYDEPRKYSVVPEIKPEVSGKPDRPVAFGYCGVFTMTVLDSIGLCIGNDMNEISVDIYILSDIVSWRRYTSRYFCRGFSEFSRGIYFTEYTCTEPPTNRGAETP